MSRSTIRRLRLSPAAGDATASGPLERLSSETAAFPSLTARGDSLVLDQSDGIATNDGGLRVTAPITITGTFDERSASTLDFALAGQPPATTARPCQQNLPPKVMSTSAESRSNPKSIAVLLGADPLFSSSICYWRLDLPISLLGYALNAMR